MKVLYLTFGFPLPTGDSAPPSDLKQLMEEFCHQGHQVDVVTIDERKNRRPTRLVQEGPFQVLRVRTGNIFDVGLYEKGLGTVTIPWLLSRAMARLLPERRYDLVLYVAPPVTFSRIIQGLKRRQPWAKTYLILKDIFPQNARDLGMIRNPLLFAYFRRQERRLYRLSDSIGCMSPGNVAYLRQHSPEIPADRLEVLPNTRTPGPDTGLLPPGPLRRKYGIPEQAVVALYGGNLGVPQGLDFLLQVFEANRHRSDLHFLLVGRGTERKRLAEAIATKGLTHVTLLSELPRLDYEALARECDIGMICLDPRFTIPNFPSRVLSYFEIRMPVLAALDRATDFGAMLEASQAGLWCLAGDLATFQAHLDRLAADPALRARMGAAGRRHLEANFTSNQAYEKIFKHFRFASL
ncbi:MAG: glycosyltransferase family 4 protein [Holophagaceae bacterium]|uniref:Glycosyltransferase family 4 protein n=1 Tax=Candidatus Geothrix skivensis TaxID=2954439 RepID=A0A9D7SHF2_9BACT|nr:glycosyltransferase family 4 protein [Candidatus Geothrix skivensis]